MREKFNKLTPVMRHMVKTITILSSIASIIPVLLIYFPLTDFNPKVIGRWDSSYSYPITDGKMSFKGHTDFFHGGKYNVSGTMTLEGLVKDEKYSYTYNVVGAGNWTADNDRVSVTLLNLNSFAKSIQVAGVDFSPQMVENITGIPTPSLSAAYPGGMSDEYDLQSASAETLILQTRDPFGKFFTIELHRQG